MKALSGALAQGLAVSCHDCSEGGLAVAAAEMAFAGQLGLTLRVQAVPTEGKMDREDQILFSESATRFLVEVTPSQAEIFEQALTGFPAAQIGQFQAAPQFEVLGLKGQPVIQVKVDALQQAWREPFREW